MSKNAMTVDKLLSRNRKILENILFQEELKSHLIQYHVFTANVVEELFNVSIEEKCMTCAVCIKD